MSHVVVKWATVHVKYDPCSNTTLSADSCLGSNGCKGISHVTFCPSSNDRRQMVSKESSLRSPFPWYSEKIRSDYERNLAQSQPCTILLRVKTQSNSSDTEDIECSLDSQDGGGFVKIRGGNANKIKDKVKKGELKSGLNTILSSGSYINSDGELIIPDVENMQVGTKPGKGGSNNGNGQGAGNNNGNSNNRYLQTTAESKELLIIRVVASDAATTQDEISLSDSWFGELKYSALI